MAWIIVKRTSIGLVVLLASLAAGSGNAAVSGCQSSDCINLVFDGDSISAGAGSSHGRGLDRVVADRLGDDVQVSNVAVGGRPVQECLRLYQKLVAPLYDPSARRHIIAFHAGDNDIAQGRNAAQTYAAFTDYVAAAHRQGWKVVVTTELRHPDWSPYMEGELEEYNFKLKRNLAGADAVVDLDTDQRLREFSYRKDLAIFTRDGIHPSDGGYAILADLLAPAVKAVAGR